VFGVGRPEPQPAGDKPQDGGEPSQSSGPEKKPSGPGKRVVTIGAVAAAVALAGGGYALSQGDSPSSQAAHVQLAQASGPIRLESITPAAGTTHVDGAQPITVSFSGPLAADSPDPTLQPAISGSWSTQGDDLVFNPSYSLPPSAEVTVQVPGGPAGVRGTDGGLLASTVTDHFKTEGYSELRLAEVLGELGYLPLTWTPYESGAERMQQLTGPQTQAALAFEPPPGTFTWRAGYPYSLRDQWSSEQSNLIVRGAVMAFQSQHGMTVGASVDQHLWQALFRAAAAGQQNANGYSYAIASKALPETLTIWHNGRVVFRSLANTGIPVSPTVDGTFPVYLRLRYQIMRGTNPDGSSYADPVSFVSYFNGGDAVHYFPRGSYGFQQSLGCVELPYSSAEQAYPYLTYGSLVSVMG
jgi:hypothetical protein